MQVLYSPQINEFGDSLEYEFVGDKIIVTYNGEVDEFDFTGMPEGCIVKSYGKHEKGIISALAIEPVLEASRTNGVLRVQLVKFIGQNATEVERFPNWIEVVS